MAPQTFVCTFGLLGGVVVVRGGGGLDRVLIDLKVSRACKINGADANHSSLYSLDPNNVMFSPPRFQEHKSS